MNALRAFRWYYCFYRGTHGRIAAARLAFRMAIEPAAF